MNAYAACVYATAVLGLWLKLFVTIAIQARERHRTRTYRYPEDATHWGGTVTSDSELCTRAQSLLRNDSETQPFFYVLGLLLLWLDTSGVTALYFTVYVLSRFLHAVFLLRARQPQRNYAFAVGVLTITCMAVHALILVGIRAAGGGYSES